MLTRLSMVNDLKLPKLTLPLGMTELELNLEDLISLILI